MSSVLSFVNRSLRLKIIAWSFIPTSIILLAVALVTFYAYQQVTEDLVIGRNQELTRLSAGQLGADLTQYSDVLTSLARTADIYRGEPALQQTALTSAKNELVVYDAGVLLLNRSGVVVAAEPPRPNVLGQNWSNRGYYHQILRSGSTVFSDVVADGPQGSNVIVVAVPITDDRNEFQGTLAGMFHLGATAISTFYGGIVKLRIGDDGTTYIVDSNGRVIYHSDADRIGEDFSNRPVVRRLLNARGTEPNTPGIDGQGIVASYAAVPGTSWSLVTEEQWGTLMSASQGYRTFLLLLLALGVVVPAVVVTLGVRRITGPIGKLISASQEVAGGKFGQTIDVRTGDELERLATQFNAMSAELQESYSDLERKVAERTKELEAAVIENARLSQQAQQLAVVEERNRLARDLHDSVTQAMYSATLYAEAATRLLSAGQVAEAADHLRDLRATAQQALREMRALIFELRPPVLEKEGLIAALQARLESVEGRAGIRTDFQVEGAVQLSTEIESGLYGIAQEALNNVLKHSGAQVVRLHLCRGAEMVTLEIADDGTGFELDRGRECGGLGLRGMEERADAMGGRLRVSSAPGQGTTVRVEVVL